MTYACEFHGGFGGAPWSRYGQDMSPAMHPYSADQVVAESKIKLIAPSMVKAIQDKETKLTINYTYTAENENPMIQLLLDIGPAITIKDNNSVILNGKDGEHVFTIVPNTNGMYRLVLTARALNQSESAEQREIIYVKVAEK